MKPVLCIMGPTASGKTALAAHLRKHLSVDLVSVDSALVYRGMDIGTAKPGASLPHRLVDILDPLEPYSAARFREDALQEIESIQHAGQVPLLVGGTMLYFRALFHGLADMPAADPDVRAGIEAQAGREGWGALHEKLAHIDPAAASRIHPNDPQRIQRALEVHALTGRTISELQDSQSTAMLNHVFHKLAVCPHERAELHRRIEARLQLMMEQGLLDEVAHLRARGDLDTDLPSMRAVGYRQMWAHLDGRCDLGTATLDTLHATRQLAKRQLTWLRREDGLQWLDSSTEDWLDQGLGWARTCLGL